jgi:hypothetical protein
MERRKSIRHQCQLPIRIVRIGACEANRLEQTMNFSRNGVCFWSSDPLEVGQSIRYEIAVSSLQSPVLLSCEGDVVRCIPVAGVTDSRFEIAITMGKYRFATVAPMVRYAAAAAANSLSAL